MMKYITYSIFAYSFESFFPSNNFLNFHKESQSNAERARNEAAATNVEEQQPTVEEEKEAEGLKLYIKNHEKHYFFRPVFFQLDLESFFPLLRKFYQNNF